MSNLRAAFVDSLPRQPDRDESVGIALNPFGLSVAAYVEERGQ